MRKFKIKETQENILNTFRMEIEIRHGDDDYRETLYLGPYQQDELFIVAGIEKAFQEMEELDRGIENRKEYDHSLNFRRYLKKHWKEDVEAEKVDRFYYAYMKAYRIFHTDEKGVEHEIEDIQCNEEPSYYYICVHEQTRQTFFEEGDVIVSIQPFEEELVKEWGLHYLEEGQKFLDVFGYREDTHLELVVDDEEFLIKKYYIKSPMKTEQEEEMYDNEIERLQAIKR